MAQSKTGAENGAAETKTDTKKTVDYIEKIGGNLNMTNAKEIFGDNALNAIKAVAAAGGYGWLNDDTINHDLWGGLQMPVDGEGHPNTKEQRVKINEALNNL